jgi:ubiquinone/menaquinone biosynthesis C-methylase UbiE
VGLTPSPRADSDNFYDIWTELFLRGSGPVFQAGLVRTGDPPREDPEASVLALAERAGLRAGDRVLDAGCGVAGPAIIIASHYPNTVIDGITNSKRQVEIARRAIGSVGLADRVRVHLGDYHKLPFRAERFDQVLFFESTGYASDLDTVCSEAFRVLGAGGRLYAKDVFRIADPLDADRAEHMDAFDRLWGCVRSKTMVEMVDSLTRAGFDVELSERMDELGTARFAGSMFDLQTGGLGRSGLGEAFLVRDLDPPIEFGEISALKP